MKNKAVGDNPHAGKTPGGGADSPICVDFEPMPAAVEFGEGGAAPEEMTEDEAGPVQKQWVFYGTLLHTANVTEEVLSTIPHLQEFMHNKRPDGVIVFRARFRKGNTLHREWFIEEMKKFSIAVDPTSIPLPMGQPPPQHSITQARVHRGQPVEFHWRAGDVLKRAEEVSRPVRRKLGRPRIVDQPERNYNEMRLGEIIEIIKTQDGTIKEQEAVIVRQRESIRILTETGSARDTGRIAQVQADNDSLQAENAEVLAQNSRIKAELRGMQGENKRLKAELEAAIHQVELFDTRHELKLEVESAGRAGP